MKELSTITVSYQTARRLAGAGFPQRSVLSWYRETDTDEGAVRVETFRLFGYEFVAAAPTLAEILADLDARGVAVVTFCLDGGTVCAAADECDVGHVRGTDVPELRAELMRANIEDCCDFPEPHGNPAVAAAALWLALVDGGHVTPAEVSS